MKKIVVIGPESTGKSTLAAELAHYYETNWVEEYARRYLLEKGMDYKYEDLLTIAKGQLDLENQIANDTHRDLLFIDTDMYVMKVWCEFVFSNCHTWILNQLVENRYNLYLLCNTDLPWVKDELREYPDLANREVLYQMYKDIVVNQDIPWIDISGDKSQRLRKAIDGIDKYILRIDHNATVNK